MTVSLLSQNRNKGTRGIDGGGDGKPGRQWKLLEDGTRIELNGITSVNVKAGESIRIETPGGGACGKL